MKRDLPRDWRNRGGMDIRAFLIILLLVLLFNFLAGILFGYHGQKLRLASVIPSIARAEPRPAEAKPEAVEPQSGYALKEINYRIREGDNLDTALKQFGVPTRLSAQWIKVADPFYDLKKIKPGQTFKLSYGHGGELQQFDFGISRDKHLLIARREGGFQAEIRNAARAEPESRTANPGDRHLYEGSIETSFYEAGLEAGMDPGLIANLTNQFSDLIDFSRHLQPGDRFSVMTEVTASVDELILVGEFEVNKKLFRIFYYKDTAGAHYYDEAGKALQGFVLIKPVPGARVSSGFSYSRYNSLLGYSTPHLAVDYAAPLGTKVRAAGAGVVTRAGWNGGYGNYLEIRHSYDYTTTYGHLYKIASGIHAGSRVKQGQTIGYVGSTGLSTGPHLDYRVIKRGRKLNPMRVKTERTVVVRDLKSFKQNRLLLALDMDTIKQGFLSSMPETVFGFIGRR